MNAFWFATISLTLLALLIVIIPIFISKKRTSIEAYDRSYQSQNVSIFEQRLAELEAEKMSGVLTSDNFDQIVSELKSTLLIDAQSSSVKNKSQASYSSIILILTCFALIPVSAYLLYFELGSLDELSELQALQFDDNQIKEAKHAAEQGDITALLKQLHEKLLANQDNLEGWALLARSSMNSGNYLLAEESYLQIIRLLESTNQDSAPVYGLLAQSRYYQNRESMTDNVDSAIKEALARDPNEVNSLGLLAIHSFTINKFETAIRYWKQILEFSPDHPSRISIEAGIERAQSALEIPLKADQVTEVESYQISKNTNQVAQVILNLSLSPEVRGMVSPTDVIFVFAKSNDKDAPPMPLAARKISVNDLPITLSLTDKNSMSPMAKLSDSSSVNVSARVSMSGQPIASPGDFEGSVKAISVLDNKSISLVIDRKL